MVIRKGMTIPNLGFSLKEWRSHQQAPTLSSWVPSSPTYPFHVGLECAGEMEGLRLTWKGVSVATGAWLHSHFSLYLW